MKITRRVLVSIIYMAVAIGVLIAPATAILATAGSAAAAPTTVLIPLHGGGGGGGGVGAPNTYGGGTFFGSHECVWEYGPGLTYVPHVDTTVYQSR